MIEYLKRQQYPKTKIKVGAVLFQVDVSECDDGSISIDIDEWVVRSIRKNRNTQTSTEKRGVGFVTGSAAPTYVSVTAKIKGVTWVRQSKKVNDFGWSNSIPADFRTQFLVNDDLPFGMFTTPLAALKWALKNREAMAVRYKEYRDETPDEKEIAEWNEEIELVNRSIRILKARITKLKSK